jgi:nucleoside phosphorylase/tetratricopeptide (TPR) repeat protein
MNFKAQHSRCAVVLTALPVECRAVLTHLSNLKEVVHPEGTVYRVGDFVGADAKMWKVAVVEIGAGNAPAALETERAIKHFRPKVVLFVGVAGGLKKDLAIGDVVAARKVYGYESGKVASTFLPRASVGCATYPMEQRARVEASSDDWMRRLPDPAVQPRPRVYVEAIAAGEKVLTESKSELCEFLRTACSDAYAVEMEGRGFSEAVRANRVDGLVVRGISDMIDGKSEAELAGSQELAARHASAFAFEVLAKFLPPATNGQWMVRLDVPVSDLNDPLVSKMIEQLRELSSDAELALKRVDPGSAIIVVEGTRDGFERTENLFTSGEIADLQGIKIMGVRWMGDLEATTQQTLEVVTGVAQKVADIWESARALSASADESSFDAEIDEAKAHLDRFDYPTAVSLLNRLRERKLGVLKPRQRFRILTNLATGYLRQNKPKEAAELFLEAKRSQPEDERALANEALAHLLLEAQDVAFSLASDVRRRFPLSSLGVAVWLRSAPPSLSVEELESEIPPALAQDVNVAVAMVDRALASSTPLVAERFGRFAVRSKNDWSYSWLCLGRSILAGELLKARADFTALPVLADRERLTEAESCLSKAVELSHREMNREAEAGAFVNRAQVRQILGGEADSDFQEAFRLCPEDPPVIRAYAAMLLRMNRIDDAVRELRRAVALGGLEDVRVFLAVALRDRGRPGDSREATNLFMDIAKAKTPQPEGFRQHVVVSALGGLAQEGRLTEAGVFLDQIPDGTVSGAAMCTFRARAILLEGDREGASLQADAALSQASGETSHEDLRLLAALLSELGRHGDALPIWQRLAPVRHLSNDTRALIHCASTLGDHGTVLTTCRALRQAGVQDGELLNLELGLLELYDPSAALALMNEHLSEHPDDRVVRFRLSIMGLRLNRPDLLSGDPTVLPEPEDIPSANWPLMIRVMRAAGHGDASLRFAYGLLRHHFSDANAHRAYMEAVLPGEHLPAVPAPETAAPGVAVCFVETGSSQEQWLILEDSPDPDRSRNEVAPDSLFAANVTGKRVGDTFVIAEGSLQNRTAVIKGILSKFVYRFQDCCVGWQLRFPDLHAFEAVRVVKPGATVVDEHTLDLTSLEAFFDRQEKERRGVEDLYRTQGLPFHLFGLGLHRNSFETVHFLAQRPDIHILCCSGSEAERTEALRTLQSCSAVVMELSAIATLSLLERLELLKTWPVPVIVTQGTVTELEQSAAKESAPSLGFLTKFEGSLAIVKDTPEGRKARVAWLRNLIDSLRSSCNVVGCQELASIDAKKRETLKNAFGTYGAESIVLASRPGHVLWTDDRTLAGLARTEFGTPRVWTQVALEARAASGGLPLDIFYSSSAQLVGWGYRFTSPSLPMALAAAMLAGWNQNAWPLKQALEQLADPSIAVGDALRLAAGFITRAHREIVLLELRSALMASVFRQLAGRPEGLQLVDTLLSIFAQVSPGQMGLDDATAAEMLKAGRQWLADKERGLAIL